MINSIHQSTLSMGLRCGEQLRRRYFLGEIIPPSVAAARGTGLHKASEINLRQKVSSKKDLPVDDMMEVARDSYLHSLSNGVFLPKSLQPEKKKLLGEGLDQCVRLTGLYGNVVAPQIEPIEVERAFKLDIGLDLPIAGKIDHEQNRCVDDLKSTTRKWAEGKINAELQPVFYSIAHEYEFNIRPEFRYHILIAHKRSEAHQLQTRTCTDADYQALIYRLKMFIHMVKSGVFLPAEVGSWACTEKWCGYWTTCPYVGNGPAKRWI